jgi:hypothetical protein
MIPVFFDAGEIGFGSQKFLIWISHTTLPPILYSNPSKSAVKGL